ERIPLKEAIESWMKDVPKVKRAAWLADRLSQAMHIDWQEKAPPPSGVLRIPANERARILRRLNSRYDRGCDPPEEDELSDIVSECLTALGRRHEALALRLQSERFSESSSGKKELPFSELLYRHLKNSSAAWRKPEQIVRFLEEKLQINWIAAP